MNSLSIGSESSCDIVVACADVRPMHCKLIQGREAWRVAPVAGTVGVQGENGIQWKQSEFSLNNHSSIWLTDSLCLTLPWPTEVTRCLSVGRAKNCDLQLDRDNISGRHALLYAAPNATAVLMDDGSTNGIYLDASCSNRLRGIAVIEKREIYLGSISVPTECFLSPLSSSTKASSSTERDSPVKRKPEASSERTTSVPPKAEPSDPPTAHRLPNVWIVSAVSIGLAVLVFLFSGMFGSGANDLAKSNANPIGQDTSVMEESNRDEAPSLGDVAKTIEEESRTNGTGESSVAIMWITLKKESTGDRFRLGTGIAVSPNLVMTPASVISAANELQSQGFSELTAYSVISGEPFSVSEFGSWKVYEERMQQASQIESLQRGHRVDGVADSDVAPNKEQDKLVQFAWAVTDACDLGWIKTDRIDSWSAVAENVSLQPGSTLELRDAGFDSGNPLLNLTGNFLTSDPNLRIDATVSGFGPSKEGVEGLIYLSAPTDRLRGKTMIGCPVFRHGELVGVITHSREIEDSDQSHVEVISSNTLQLALQDVP